MTTCEHSCALTCDIVSSPYSSCRRRLAAVGTSSWCHSGPGFWRKHKQCTVHPVDPETRAWRISSSKTNGNPTLNQALGGFLGTAVGSFFLTIFGDSLLRDKQRRWGDSQAIILGVHRDVTVHCLTETFPSPGPIVVGEGTYPRVAESLMFAGIDISFLLKTRVQHFPVLLKRPHPSCATT